MREVLEMTEENKEGFFSQDKIRSNTVFTVPNSLMDEVVTLSEKAGLIIETYDPEGRFKNVSSSIYIPHSAENALAIISLTEEKTIERIAEIKSKTGLTQDNLAVYRNGSDYGHLNERTYDIIKIIPKENMQNSSSDCVKIKMNPPLKRKEIQSYKNMDYDKWNAEHKEKDENYKEIGPDDLMYGEQITRIENLMTIEDFNNIEINRKIEVKEIISEASNSIVDGTFDSWYEENQNRFKLKVN